MLLDVQTKSECFRFKMRKEECLNSPTLQAVTCGQLDVTLKDIVSGICTVQEEGFLTDWNDFFYNDAKLGVSDEMGKLFDSLLLNDS